MILPSYTSSARTLAVPGALQMPFGIQKRHRIESSTPACKGVMRGVVVPIYFRDKITMRLNSCLYSGDCKNGAHPAGMSGGDVITFCHTRGWTHYRASKPAFLDSWQETSLFLHHGPSSEFRAYGRDLLKDSLARGVIYLGVVHKVWEWGFILRAACVNLVVGSCANLWRCESIVSLAREAYPRE